MPTHFNLNCPHCRTKGAGFEVKYQWPARASGKQAHILGVCGICNAGVTLHSEYPSGQHENLVNHSYDYPGSRFIVRSISPSFIDDLPSGVPENISNFYSQGLKNLYERHWDAAGAMFRKTLDVGTKTISPERRDLTLYRRINALVEDQLLTQAMGQWSHEIRLDGNDAVHDDEPETEIDARRAQKFTEAFLTYAFTLPNLVESSRSSRLSDDDN